MFMLCGQSDYKQEGYIFLDDIIFQIRSSVIISGTHHPHVPPGHLGTVTHSENDIHSGEPISLKAGGKRTQPRLWTTLFYWRLGQLSNALGLRGPS